MSLCMARSIETHGQKIVWTATAEHEKNDEKCPGGASLLLFRPGSSNSTRLPALPQCHKWEIDIECCELSTYHPSLPWKWMKMEGLWIPAIHLSSGIPPRTPHNGWYRPHQSFHRKLQRCQPSPDNGARGQLGWFCPCQGVLKKLPMLVTSQFLVVDR